MAKQEIEAKFYVQSPEQVQKRLVSAGAILVRPRILETNLRFDTPQGHLQRNGQVLRLRQDNAIHLTYKGTSQETDGILSRDELEFEVENFETARAFLEALGYMVVAVYEKYRAAYEMSGCHITLDELPYGTFIEIEGPDPDSVQRLTRDLGLDPAKAIVTSYLGLHRRLCAKHPLDPTVLTFAALAGISISASDLEIEPADII
jgi:adenylate cyclase class 2